MRTYLHAAAFAGALLVLGPVLPPAPGASWPGRGSVRAQEPDDPRVLPGDLVRIKVWREPEMDGDYLVDPFGVVTLPLVGDLDVTGETQRSLKARLQEVYATEIADLALTVLILKRVRVSGEVRGPGIYAMEPTARVADALLMAGGRGEFGRWHQILLRRGGETRAVHLLEDASLAALAVETGDEILVMERGWLSRNATALAASGMGVVGVILALVVR